MPEHVLVIYATAQGQTRRIAERLAAALGRSGFDVDLRDLAEPAEDFSLERYRGVLLGAPVHGGHHLHEAVEFARRHHAALAAVPSGFFSVSLAAADEDDESRAATQEYLELFVEETGWDPRLRASVAGAFLPSHYGVFERAIMRLIAKRSGHADIHWDQEYTDWAAVDRLAGELADELATKRPAA